LGLRAAGIDGIGAIERLAGLVAEPGAEQGAGRRTRDPGVAVEQGGASQAAEAGAGEGADGLLSPDFSQRIGASGL
jgi:hypothetical protein